MHQVKYFASAMTYQCSRHPKAQEDCVEYVVALKTAMMATTAIVTLTFFLLDLI